MKRIMTAAVGAPLALAAVFYLPGPWFFLVVLGLIEIAVVEFGRLVKLSAPASRSELLLILVPVSAVVLSPGLWSEALGETGIEVLWWAALGLSVGFGTLVLLLRVPPEQALLSLGAWAFGIPYFALPVASLSSLQRVDPFIVLLLLAVVWLGDTAAFYCGRRWGRHKMAPVVSPNKTWEGSVASLVTSILVGAIWSYWRTGELRPALLLLVLFTAVAAQIGDLLESLIKRGAGVKDSGNLLPGHGGVMDRLDALFFAAPVMMLGVSLLHEGGLAP